MLKRLLTFVKRLLIFVKCLLFVENCLAEWKTCRIFAQTMKRALTYSLSCVCALVLLMGCARDGAQMREQLSALEERNSSGEPMENDSLAEALADYFDRHGSANERMRAKYILGRTYYCLGELPRALETYMEAADCADTTAADCDYMVLSRVYGQSSVIYYDQVQPQSFLTHLTKARYYSIKAKDTLATIVYYAKLSEAYKMLSIPDSVIKITDKAYQMFKEKQRYDLASQTLSSAITSIIKYGDMKRVKQYIYDYELFSGYFDKNGNIQKGREIYYYMKGEYFLAIAKLDSAEYLFRKELRDGKDLNNQIAGCRGLQKVYEQRKNSDSIAKYATLSYELNDSAYSLSEMQNIQKLQASYNYNHNKQIADETRIKVQQMWNVLLIILSVFLFTSGVSLYRFLHYKAKKDSEYKDYLHNQKALEKAQTELLEMHEENANITVLIEKKSKEINELQSIVANYSKKIEDKNSSDLEGRIVDSKIKKYLDGLLASNPVSEATQEDFKQLRLLINEEIPGFYNALNVNDPLRPIEYEICLLIRCHFKPAEICKLTGRSDSYIANTRKSILTKVYGIKGVPKDLDERILSIK